MVKVILLQWNDWESSLNFHCQGKDHSPWYRHMIMALSPYKRLHLSQTESLSAGCNPSMLKNKWRSSLKLCSSEPTIHRVGNYGNVINNSFVMISVPWRRMQYPGLVPTTHMYGGANWRWNWLQPLGSSFDI